MKRPKCPTCSSPLFPGPATADQTSANWWTCLYCQNLIHGSALVTTPRAWFDRHRDLYPDDWDLIAKRIKDAAGWACEACGVPHGPPPHVLTADHLDHVPANCTDENLIALCQRCHLKRQALRPRPTSREGAILRLRGLVDPENPQLSIWR